MLTHYKQHQTEMEVSDDLEKIKLLFEKLFEGKIVLNDYDAGKLLKFLEDRSVNNPGQTILYQPAFLELIYYYLKNINNADTSFKVLIIEIVIILFKNELQIPTMEMQGFQTLSCKLCVDNLNFMMPFNLHLACIKLATTQITNCFGLDLIIEHKIWKRILFSNIHQKPNEISKAAYEFMAKLAWKLAEDNFEPALLEVLGYIVEPIKLSEYFCVPAIDTETDAVFSEKVFPYLSTLLTVMSEPVSSVAINKIMILLREYFLFGHALYGVFIATKRLRLLKLLNPCLFLYCFQTYRRLLHNKNIDEFCNKMTVSHRNYVVQAIRKQDAFVIVDFVIQSTITLSHFEKAHATEFDFPLTFERNGQNIELLLQIAIYLLVPILKYASHERLRTDEKHTDILELFSVKLGKTITEFIFTSFHLFGTLLDDQTLQKKVAVYTLKELLRLKGHINKSQAGLLFQSLYYLLDKFILCDAVGRLVVNENSMDPDDLRILTHLLDAMKMLLQEYSIPWYENIEIVSIQANLLNLLKQRFLTTKHLVQILDLINICIKKFLSPNMSLLVENTSTQDSTLNAIGEVIKLYTQHEDWAVRDSALNLLTTCTDISFIKYIPLQKLIVENSLINLAAKAALTDIDFYPQCTALKCLAAATKIDNIWQEVLVDNENLHLQLLYILRNHSEGMVRKATVNVLTGVYTNQKLDPGFQNILYEVMQTAALDDLHWEVQLAALKFWKYAVNNHLTYRGMFDGRFPPVTFSTEKRKIVVLNNTEIQKQLTAIMNHLSSIGCLKVLLECMDEIHSTEVMNQAFSIAKDLIDILDKYKFEKLLDIIEPKSEVYVEVPSKYLEENKPALNLATASSEEEKNKVIDIILGTDKSELIIDLHDNYNQMKWKEMEIDLAYCPRRSKPVHPDEFLECFKNNDYCKRIEARKNCNFDGVCTLNRLLDEILNL